MLITKPTDELRSFLLDTSANTIVLDMYRELTDREGLESIMLRHVTKPNRRKC